MKTTCSACEQERIEFNGGLLCVVCDNPDVGEGTWFTAWAEKPPPEFQEPS